MNNKRIQKLIIAAGLTVTTIGGNTLPAFADGMDSKEKVNVEKSQEVQYAKVSIQVKNEYTGQLMKNTVVDVNGIKLKTNDQGIIEDIPMQAGHHNPVTVSREGFEKVTLKTTVFKPNQNYMEIASLAPETASHVITFVNRANGQPVKNTNVDVSGTKMTTNEDGKITLTKLWGGEQNFNINLSGFDKTSVAFNAEAGKVGETTLEVNPIAQYARVSMRIRNARTGQMINNTEFDVNGIKLKTNNEGVIEDMPVQANYNNPITISKDGFQSTTLKTTVFEANKNYVEDVNLSPEMVKHVITIVDRVTGKPVANTKVKVATADFTTDENGKLTLEKLWEGEQTFEIKVNGYDNTSVSFKTEIGKEGETTVEVNPTAQYARVSMRIRNARTGQMINNTEFDVNGIKLKTNNEGVIEDMPVQANYNNPITISKDGFQSTTLKTTVFEANKNYVEDVNLSPEMVKHVITIVDRVTGKPVANTKVKVATADFTTDENGKLTLEKLWEGEQTFEIKVNGYDNTSVSFKTEIGKEGETTVEVNPTAQYARVSIKVRNARTGQMINNTELDVNGIKLKTNDEGVIEDMPVQANYNNPITVSKEGFQSTTLKTTVFEANKNYVEEINLAPEMVKHVITIVDRVTGKPVANTKVKVATADFTTDENGKLTLEKLWEGEQTFEIKVNGYDNTSVSFKTEIGKEGETTVEVNPTAQYARVSIKVRNARTGQMINNTELDVNGIKLKTNDEGVIEDIPVQANYNNPITVSKEGFKSTTLKTTVFEANKNHVEEIKLSPEKAIHTIVLLDKETKKAIANANVEIDGEAMKTDKEGKVTLDGLSEGEKKIEVKVKGFNSAILKINADTDKEGMSLIEMERNDSFVVLPDLVNPEKPDVEKPDVEKPDVEKPDVEKPVTPEVEKPVNSEVVKPVTPEIENLSTSDSNNKAILAENNKAVVTENPDTSDKGVMTFVIGIAMGIVALVAINGKKLFKAIKG